MKALKVLAMKWKREKKEYIVTHEDITLNQRIETVSLNQRVENRNSYSEGKVQTLSAFIICTNTSVYRSS